MRPALFRRGKYNKMGKKLIPDDAWSAAIGAISKTTDYSNWKWSDVAKAAGAGLASASNSTAVSAAAAAGTHHPGRGGAGFKEWMSETE